MQQWDDAPGNLHVQYFEWRFTGPELKVQTDTQWASALKTLALFYLTAVQMWTDGIILATIWLWDLSPLISNTLKKDEDCKAKRDPVHIVVKLGWKTNEELQKCYIHTNSHIDCSYIKLLFIKYRMVLFFLFDGYSISDCNSWLCRLIQLSPQGPQTSLRMT